MAGQAVGTAVVRVGQDGVDDGQHTATVLLVDLDDRLAAQRAAIQRVGRGLVVIARAEHLGDFFPADDARIDNAWAREDLVPQHLSLSHGAGQHHGVDAIEIGVGGILGLLLHNLEHEPLLRTGREEQRGRHDRHQDQHQGQVDLCLHGHLSGGGAVVHGFP